MTTVEGDIFFNDNARKKLDYGAKPVNPEFVTVVTVDPIEPKNKQPFVTILSIGAVNNDNWNGSDSEEVLVYRLPGERLGFGLKFDGGLNANEKVSKLMIQSCAPDSPASRTVVSWGHFSPGDEILQIDDVPVTEMTRMECVRSLKESNVQLKLRVKKGDINNIRINSGKQQVAKNIPPPVPPRKYPRRNSKSICARSTNGLSDGSGFDKEKALEREKFNVPEPQVYTDLIGQETASLANHESESDDTGSSMSTVVDKQFSTPTTSNSSFSDVRSITSAEITGPPSPDDFAKRKFDLDKVLEPFLQLEREFSSSVTIEDNNDLFQKLVAAAILKENPDGSQVMLDPPDKFQDQCYQTQNITEIDVQPEEPPKPLPRKEIPKTVTKYGKKRPPPPPPQVNEKSNRCPTPDREDHHESSDSDISVDRLPRLIDFVPKDRVDLVIPSAVHPNPVDVLLEHQRILAIVHPETTDHEGSHASVNEVLCNVQEPVARLPRSELNQPIEVVHRTDTSEQKITEQDAERSRPFAQNCFEDEDTKMDSLLTLSSPPVILNVPSSPPAYSRMPPDGHEFPQNYQEIGPNGTYELTAIPAVPGSEPPSYTVDAYYTKKSAYIDVINEAKLLDVERKPSENDADTMKMAMSSHNKPSFSSSKTRNGDELGMAPVAATRTRGHASWRNDEKSERSVKDKIAMFSSAIVKAGSKGTSNGSSGPSCGNLSKSRHRSSEDNVALVDGGGVGSMLHSRVYSKSIYSMNSIGCRGGSYSDVMSSTQPSYHHHGYGGGSNHLHQQPQQQRGFKSKDTYPVLHCQRASVGGVDSTNPINIMNRTQSSIDLTLSSSSCSSAYSSCSPDSSLSPMSSPSYTIGSSSTLPRKHKSHHLTNGTGGGPNNSTSCFSSSSSTSSTSSSSSSSYNDKKHTSLTRTTSFTGTTTLHSRSQSLVDVLHTPHRYGNYEDSAASSRKDSLTTLIEQRRRTMSKLRGLVIPEKTCESQKPIIDLPEIKSKEADRFNCCPVTGHSMTRGGIKQEHTTAYDSSWKSVLNASDMPKYSPAFKRKTLTVYGVSSSASSLSSSLNSSREELRSDNIVSKTNKSPPPAKPPRNSVTNAYNNPQLLYGPPVYKSLFANNPSNNHTLNEKSTDTRKDNKSLTNDSYSISRMDVCSKLQEDSDNDSAVSSSRSSLCQEYSPPSSPSPNTEYDSQTNDRISNDSPSQSSSRTLRRTLSSETNVSVTSTISTLTSGSQASCSSNGDNSGKEGKSKRILKAESVEAINRKNVLSSAKYSCGQDFKVGSPLIKDVFENHQNGIFNTSSTTSAAEAATEDEDDDQTTPKFRLEKHHDEDNSSANWYGTGENIKVAYLEIQDSEESDFSTKENSSSADTDDNLDKSLELMSDSLCDGNYTVVDYGKKESAIKDSSISSDTEGDVPFTKLEKQVYAQVIKNQQKREDRRKSDRFHDSKITSTVPTVVAAVPAIDTKPTIHVNDIKKTFEKAEPLVKMNGIKTSQNHLRMSSMDSTTSEDSLPTTNSGSASNLLKEQQFGSITSLASSTSLISQQELQQLIDEANQTLEETAGSGGHDLMVIILHRETVTSSIGITLAGGADYETKEITVHKVLVGSPADKDGRIQKGDRILSINGRNMKGVTHREALSILKAPRSEVVLVVSRWRTDGSNDNATPVPAEDTLVATFKNTIRPPRIPEVSSDCDSRNFTSSTANNNYSKIVKGPVISVTLIKEGGGLGFSLEGGKDSPFGDLPLTIKKIFTGGCAAKSGMLHAGDELLSLNGVDVTSMSRTEAWNMMKRLSDGQVILNVRRSSSKE
ncbi:uncharacterized protein bbg isoform X2 [Planococcus citri]|uniref:uncharacterized protein bbg isoform X2 n=1 Tax=Planococcus citri TaxID=170843 RepID=UPI0031F94B97